MVAKRNQLPDDSSLQQYLSANDFVDSYSEELTHRPDLQTCDIRVFATHFATIEISWAIKLLKLRNLLMKPLQLKTTDELAEQQAATPALEKQVGDRISFFKIYEIHRHEIILGEDDWHQDFRVSLYRTSEPAPRAFMSTVCKRHNAFGHGYLAAILPFHQLIVRSTLNEGIVKTLPH